MEQPLALLVLHSAPPWLHIEGVLEAMMEADVIEVGGSVFYTEPQIISLAHWAVGSHWRFLSRGVTKDFCFRKLTLSAVYTVNLELEKLHSSCHNPHGGCEGRGNP